MSAGTHGGLTSVGLFAGIGGIERGLSGAGRETTLLCEIDVGAQRVLSERFPGVPLTEDVRGLNSLPETDLVAAGFPCTDLSQAGRTAGIGGRESGLVAEVFRLIDNRPPRWLLLENVPFMLQLDRGRAMRFLVDSLEERGFAWAYRVLDARAFGLPQRRQRVILVASKTEDPRDVLLVGDAGPPTAQDRMPGIACGFYWTEGTRGLGWAVDAVPTLKGGSRVGIASPPAVWMPDGMITTPTVVDAERLQGFDAGWTSPATEDTTLRLGHRWKLVGNAVSVPVAAWVGERLASPGGYDRSEEEVLQEGERWPRAAWGSDGKVRRSPMSEWPVRRPYQHLAEFLSPPPSPLSVRAASGFLSRARRSTLNFPDGLLEAIERHIEATGAA